MLIFEVPGAKPEEIERGKAAALEVIAKAGLTPYQARYAMGVVEAWDDAGFPQPEPPIVAAKLHLVWVEAYHAAWTTCCAGWSEDQIPDDIKFLLADDDYPERVLTEIRRFELTPSA